MKNKLIDLLPKMIGTIVLLIAAIFILRLFLSNFSQVQFSFTRLSAINIVLSIIFYLTYFYARSLSWHFNLKGLHSKSTVKNSLFSWFVGESTRYIPGGIWSFASRIYLSQKSGIPKAKTLFAMILEISLYLTIAFLISIPIIVEGTKGLSFSNSTISAILTFSGFFLLLITLLWPKIKNAFVIILKIPDKVFYSADFYTSVITQFFAWIFFGLANYALIQPLSDQLSVVTIISVSVFSWLIGYVSLVTPMGLGFREASFILLLTPFIGMGEAGVVALLSRLILTVVEVANLVLWLYVFQKSKVHNLMTKIFKKWDLILLFVFVMIYCVTLSTLSILRHNAFASNFDLANMNQTVWNTLHGRPFALSGAESTISRFSIHADLILVFLAPLYLIWEQARTLLIIQSVALGLGAVPVFLITKKLFSGIINKEYLISLISLTLALVYLLNPQIQWTNLYDFHGVALAIPFILSAFYSAYTKKWHFFWIFSFLACTTKEEVPLLIAMLGLAIAFVFREYRRGIITFILGVLWFSVMVWIVIPGYSAEGEHWGIHNLFAPAKERIVTLRTPKEAWDIFHGYFLSGSALNYYIELLKPFSFLPIFGFPWLFLAAPEFGINLLSTDAQMQTITYHYDSGITPFLLLSTIYGFYFIIRVLARFQISRKFLTPVICLGLIGMISVAFRVNYHYSPLPTTPSCWCLSYQVTAADRQFDKILKSIPPDASVASSGEIRPHVTRRENSFTLPGGAYTADYVAIIDQNRIVGDYSPKEFELNLMKDPKFYENYQLINQVGHFYLYKRKN